MPTYLVVAEVAHIVFSTRWIVFRKALRGLGWLSGVMIASDVSLSGPERRLPQSGRDHLHRLPQAPAQRGVIVSLLLNGIIVTLV